MPLTLIFNLCALGAVIFCFSLARRLYSRYLQTKLEAFKDFAAGFLSAGFGFFFLGLPKLILSNPYWVQTVFLLSDFCFLGAVLFFGKRTLVMFEELAFLRKIFVLVFSFWMIAYIFLSIIFFSPALPLRSEDIIFFWQTGVPWLSSISRGLNIAGALMIFSLSLKRGKRGVLGRRAFRKNFFIILGGTMVTLGGFILWFFPFIHFTPAVLLFSGLLASLGILIMVGSIYYYQFPQEKWVKKIS